MAWEGFARVVSTLGESDLQKLEMILVALGIVLLVPFAQQLALAERRVVYNLSSPDVGPETAICAADVCWLPWKRGGWVVNVTIYGVLINMLQLAHGFRQRASFLSETILFNCHLLVWDQNMGRALLSHTWNENNKNLADRTLETELLSCLQMSVTSLSLRFKSHRFPRTQEHLNRKTS